MPGQRKRQRRSNRTVPLPIRRRFPGKSGLNCKISSVFWASPSRNFTLNASNLPPIRVFWRMAYKSLFLLKTSQGGVANDGENSRQTKGEGTQQVRSAQQSRGGVEPVAERGRGCARSTDRRHQQ